MTVNSSWRTVRDILAFRAATSGDATAYTFLTDAESSRQSLTYAALDVRARVIAAHLLRIAEPGARILLVYPPGLDFIEGFFGCIYAGMIAVPAAPPAGAKTLPRLKGIAADAQAQAGLSAGTLAVRLQVDLPDVLWRATDTLSAVDGGLSAPRLAGENVAFLQYTSGSTADPKGVMISHANLFANLAHTRDAMCPMAPGDVFVFWVPPYHDMGLIGGILLTAYLDCHYVQFAPSVFMQKPAFWLRAISRFRARMTAAPNFAYEYCARKVTDEQKRDLDLSSLAIAVNSAERVHRPTMERFSRAFGSCGFRPDSFAPAYGLAESTLVISANLLSRRLSKHDFIEISSAGVGRGRVDVPLQASDTVILASVGMCNGGSAQEVVIVEPSTLACLPEDAVGEIWVSGPSVASGYWNKPEGLQRQFQARPAGRSKGYLRTGDLGFLRGECLFVTGRLKEVMILNGRNVYPQDVERTVQDVDEALKVDGTAVFSIEDGPQAKVVIVQELASKSSSDPVVLASRIRAAVAERHEIIDIEDICFVRTGHLPRTSSGKVRRLHCRDLFGAGRLPRMWSWKASGTQAAQYGSNSITEATLLEIVSSLLDGVAVSPADNLFALGCHSLTVLQLVQKINERFGVHLSMGTLFERPVLSQVANAIDHALTRPASTELTVQPTEPAVGEPFPLTDVQEVYWLGRDPSFPMGGVSTHLYHEFRVRKLDVPRLELALGRLTARHAALRTVVTADGQQQCLADIGPIEVKHSDFSGLAPAPAMTELARIREAISHKVHPVSRAPMLELHAVVVATDMSHLCVSMDLLMMDASSIGVFMGELIALYRDPTAQLSRIESSFRDFVLRERAGRAGPDYARALRYWSERLDDLPPAPALRLVQDPSAMRCPRFVRRSGVVAKGRWEHLKRRAGAVGVTPTVVVLAAFASVLARSSRTGRFTLNLTLLKRPAGASNLIGDFTSLLLLAVDLDSRLSFAEQAKAVQKRLWADLEHAHVSAVHLLRKLRESGPRHPHGMPVVFTSLLPNGLTPGIADVIDELGETVHGVSQTPQVWIDHQVFERRGDLHLQWDAVEALFPAGFLDGALEAQLELLERLATDESAWRSPVLQSPPTSRPLEATLPKVRLEALVSAAAFRQPNRMAVISAGGDLTYRELVLRARSLAADLKSMGVERQKLVAVSMNKGWEQAVAALAVLYAGAAYLPLEPSLPSQRLRLLITESDVGVVLSQSSLASKLDLPDTVVRISVDDHVFDPNKAEMLVDAEQVDDLAYVIHTSGSTGVPKGVMINHLGAVNTILDVNRRFSIGPDDTVLALSSLSFDLSVWDLFGALAAGATIVFPPPHSERDPVQWASAIERHRISVLNSVPALLGLLLDCVERGGPSLASLRLAMLSGDWIPITMPDRLRRLVPDARVVSLGGATEASIWSVVYEIGAIGVDWRSIPYGGALTHQTVQVLDETFTPCPPGETGEICIGGVGLSLGYWKDEEKTRLKFVRHPVTGERLYRTGDLGRYLPRGDIELLGRDDLQVKVQGHRIELTEIEATLAAYPAVDRAIAAVRGERFSARQLVAYAIRKHGHVVDEKQCRNFLATRLPAYMVPVTIHFVDSFPLTANGKVDRAALVGTEQQARAPRVESGDEAAVQSRIRQVVEDILETNQIAPEDNLFRLGATSLHAIRIANELAVALEFRPRMEDFFADPTIGGLVKGYVEQKRRAANQGPGGENQESGPFTLIVDPQARQAFKDREPGLREISAGSREVELPHRGSLDHLPAVLGSVREFDPAPVSLAALSATLRALSQVDARGKRKYLYASAGGLYPVQAYLYAQRDRIEHVERGAYYYHPRDHKLVRLGDGALPEPTIAVGYKAVEGAGFALFLVADRAAIEPVYGDLSTAFCLIEAGAMSQLLVTAAAHHRIGWCQVAGFRTEDVRWLLRLGPSHALACCLFGGIRLQGECAAHDPREHDQRLLDLSALERGTV